MKPAASGPNAWRTEERMIRSFRELMAQFSKNPLGFASRGG
jgi:hypothetical protein